MTDCIFCKITRFEEPAQIVRRGTHSLTIVPLNPVVEGHVITIPYQHVSGFDVDPHVSANTMGDAATYAQTHRVEGLADYNIIVNNGPHATQSVFHLHVHLVPRKSGDGLALPWYSGKPTTRKDKP